MADKTPRQVSIDQFLNEVRGQLQISCMIHNCTVDKLSDFSVKSAVSVATETYIKKRNRIEELAKETKNLLEKNETAGDMAVSEVLAALENK